MFISIDDFFWRLTLLSFWLWGFFALGIAISSFFFLARPVRAALPPLSSEELAAQTNCIVIGVVKNVSYSEVEIGIGTDIHYTATVEIETIDRPSPTQELKVGSEIKVWYWQAAKRPFGWAGAGGQYSTLDLDRKYRLFLTGGRENCFNLLEPNGSEQIDR